MPRRAFSRSSLGLVAPLAPMLPAADGLAAAYPGDAGLARDPAVLFADNFESGDMTQWDEPRGRVVMTDTAPHAGKGSGYIPMERGQRQSPDAIKWFLPGAATVYVRFSVRFSADYRCAHHFVRLLAHQAKSKGSGFGKAGQKPEGPCFSTGMEPWFAWGKNPPPGEVNRYSYFPDMSPDPKMPGKYWGNAFFPPGPTAGEAASAHRVLPALDRWQCWQFMLPANTAPDRADGRQALWLDGKLAGEFPGIRWRNNPDLKVNCLWLEHSGYDAGDPAKRFWSDSQSGWFDDVVVATRYIGPVTAP